MCSTHRCQSQDAVQEPNHDPRDDRHPPGRLGFFGGEQTDAITAKIVVGEEFCMARQQSRDQQPLSNLVHIQKATKTLPVRRILRILPALTVSGGSSEYCGGSTSVPGCTAI